MSVFVPSYLYLSRHNVYYFRWPVPASLHPMRKRGYIRLSLDTRNPKEAVRLSKWLECYALTIQGSFTLDMDYSEIKKILKEHFKRLLEAEKEKINKNGPMSQFDVDLTKNEISRIENITLKGKKNRSGLNKILEEEADDLIKLYELDVKKDSPVYENLKDELEYVFLAYCKELLDYNDKAKLYDFSISEKKESTALKVSSLTLKQAVDDFIAEREQGKTWGERAKQRRIAQCAFLMEFLGENYDIASLDAKEAAKIKKALQCYPKNKNKNPKTRNLSLKEAIEAKGVPKLDTATINDYLTTYKGLFGWAVDQGYIEKSPFSKLAIRQKTSDEKKRKGFNKGQIKSILEALPKYMPDKCKKSYPYWGTLIGIYTGARVNEITQLELEDIKQEDGIWYFDFNDEGEQKHLKSKSSRRRVPIHESLLSLGILERIDELKKAKHTRLFPDLKHNKTGGFGRYLSRWMNDDFLVSLGIKEKGLSFHGLRHTCVTNLLNAGVSEGIVQDIVGHKKKGVTENVYNKGYSLSVLQEAINKLDYSFGVEGRK